MEKNELIDSLNTLIETSRDGEKGFMTCAEDVKDVALRAYFTICATRCRESVHTLAELVKHHGGTPEETGSLLAPVDRAWVDLRAAISSDSDLAVLEECERAEDVALRAFRRELQKDLPLDVSAVIRIQLNGVQENHDRVRNMRDERKRLAA
ncbi:MAG: PA2169 family four-helix-bundle protein [Burkholderiales bacterium]|nr:PA2169 family four-helix-bundle protein [Burkholderiales bacterium]